MSIGEQPAAETNRAKKSVGNDWGWMIAYVCLAVFIPLVYVGITHHVWEDFLITFRQSRNLVEGKGLQFNAGRRIQGFTSVLNTMLPAIFYAISGRSETAALNLYRAVCLIAYVGGGWITLRIMLREPGRQRSAAFFFILFYVTEVKTVAFTMNGQEAAFMVFFLSLGLAGVYWGMGRFWWVMGLSWAGLLYSRADSAVFIMALALAGMVFRNEDWCAIRRGLLKAATMAVLLFSPWLIWATIYYGQPIPNTVLAKSALTFSQLMNPGGLMLQVLQAYPLVGSWVFEPIYVYLGGWPSPILDAVGLICAGICTAYWMIPSDDRLGRLASLLFTVSVLYLSLVHVGYISMPWYLPSAGVFAMIVLARAPLQIAGRIPWTSRRAPLWAHSFQAALVMVSTFFLVEQTIQIRIQQFEIEDNLRRPIGLYLHDVVRPEQRIYLEPLGYVGYYSDRLILDWPGLVAPEVVRLHHEMHLNQYTIIPELSPEWLVLRARELKQAIELPYVRNSYTVVRVFDASESLKQYSFIPGRGYLDNDTIFYVLKRRDVQPAASPPPADAR